MTCNFRRNLHILALLASSAGLPQGCDRQDSASSKNLAGTGLQAVWTIPTHLHKKLVENSIAVTSVRPPWIIFGVNDSRNEPLLFAMDSTGAQRAVWSVSGAQNIDWEAASLGPCGADSCLYIGDIGDNDAKRRYVSIYRVREPEVPTAIPDSLFPLPARRLDFRYPDQPHDVEAMYVAPDGAMLLITKRRLLDRNKRPRPALIYRLPASAWDSSGIVTAALVDSLPIIPGSARGRQVTDAALSADGSHLAVRTYAEVFIFSVDSARGLPRPSAAATSCSISGLDEYQGEGIGWWWDQRRLLLTSEGRNAPFFVIECALPGL